MPFRLQKATHNDVLTLMPMDMRQLRLDLEDILSFLPSYARNPVEGIRRAPLLSWPALLSLQIGFAATSGAIGGLFSLNFWNVLLGLLVFPLTSLLQLALIAFFLKSAFSSALDTRPRQQRLFGIVVLANLPYLVLHALYAWVPAIDLIGFLTTCILLIVGLSEHFGIERRRLAKLIGAVYLLFFLIWGVSQYRTVTRLEQHRERFSH